VADQSSLGEELRCLRLAAGLTIADLSARSRVRQEYLTVIEENREEPSAAALRRIADQLDPSGAAYKRLGRLLTIPEPDWAGNSNYNPAQATSRAVHQRDLPERSESADANAPATVIGEVWRHKSDSQVIAAADSIAEYSEQARHAIRSELERRGLTRSEAAARSASVANRLPARTNAIRLFEIDGIPIFLHWSWFLAAVYELGSRQSNYSSFTWNILEYLSLFAIVLLHELGHVVACRSVGGRADRIILWPLGGIAYVKPPPRPGATLWSIAAGPAVNVLLVPIIGTLWAMVAPLGYTDLNLLIRAAANLNLVLLFFNLLPVYPLDGGQILGALLWFVVGRARALMITTVIGFAGVAGLVWLAVSHRSPWLGLMAFFIGSQCLAAFKHARLSNILRQAVGRSGFACPACDTKPPLGPFWTCGACGTTADPFEVAESAPEAVCAVCGTPISTAACFACGDVRPLREWRLSNRVYQNDTFDRSGHENTNPIRGLRQTEVGVGCARYQVFCIYCGHPGGAEDVFCRKCGKPVPVGLRDIRPQYPATSHRIDSRDRTIRILATSLLTLVIATLLVALYAIGRTSTTKLFTTSQFNSRIASEAVLTLLCFDRQGTTISQGSGFLVRSDGVAVTNWHVAQNAFSILAITGTNRTYRVQGFVNVDSPADLVLMQLTGGDGGPFPVLRAGDLRRASVGQRVFTVSAPQGLAQSVSDGILSAIRGLQGRAFLQITAPVSPGSSGGPVFNESGEVIGVIDWRLSSGQNLNFAIPIDSVLGLLHDLPTIAEYESTARSDPQRAATTTTPLFDQGVRAYKKKQFAAAGKLFSEVFASNPRARASAYDAGLAYIAAGDHAAAIDYFNRYVSIAQDGDQGIAMAKKWIAAYSTAAIGTPATVAPPAVSGSAPSAQSVGNDPRPSPGMTSTDRVVVMVRNSAVFHRENCPLVAHQTVTRFRRSQLGGWATPCTTCRPDDLDARRLVPQE
jgi:S1-C subfamily serine protease/Zn-dependent protease/transcriptional regulator with XRE-family HTH domain